MPPPGFGLLVDGWEQVEGMDSSSLSVPAGVAFMKALHIHRIRLQQQSGDGTKHKQLLLPHHSPRLCWWGDYLDNRMLGLHEIAVGAEGHS